MKTLRYMLIVAALLSVMSASAHMFDKQWGQKPVMEMRSTSAMAYSGSTLPQAAATGVTLATITDVETSTRAYHPGHIRRATDGGDDDWEDDEWGHTDDPWATPLGDVLWPLICLALAYGVYLKCRKKKEIS